jgi:cbb3-type cytochrome oxidase maturation protein
MTVIYILIPVSILFASIFLGCFIWAVRSGQYEDTFTPSMRPLMDDHAKTGAEADASTQNQKTTKT